jgi:hypothetical protein
MERLRFGRAQTHRTNHHEVLSAKAARRYIHGLALVAGK